jgi:hypothetical protein
MRFHLPARDHVVMDWVPAHYVIRVDGQLGAIALSAFPAMTPQQQGTHTVLTGWLDQSALHGVLAEIEALGLVLLEVRQMEPRGISPESGATRSAGEITEIQ